MVWHIASNAAQDQRFVGLAASKEGKPILANDFSGALLR
jgi:hypothetical protein